MDKIAKLYKIANDNSISVMENCPQEIVAMSFKFPTGKRIIALMDYNSEITAEEALPYTKLECFAHEMGHCETDSFYGFYSSLETRGKHEYRANKWAINYVVPFDELCRAVSKGNRELWQLAEYFDVSPEFMEKAINYHASHGRVVKPRTKF